MKKQSPRKTMRQLTELTPAQLRRLKRVLAAVKGMPSAYAREVLEIVLAYHSEVR